jgi:hypothetical protein
MYKQKGTISEQTVPPVFSEIVYINKLLENFHIHTDAVLKPEPFLVQI